MAKKDESKAELRKNGTSRRTRAGSTRNNRGTPPILMVAVVVVIIGAALLFWPKGGSVPTGIGEHQSVLTLPDTTLSPASLTSTNDARSGDVDITAQTPQLTPEKPEGDQPKQPAPAETVVKKTVPRKTTKPPRKKTVPKPEVPTIQPGPDGRWAVQTGGFGNAANADQEAARLKTAGWNAMVRAGSNSQGDMVYRVWLGYFTSRETASTFIGQNRKNLVDAFPVHR